MKKRDVGDNGSFAMIEYVKTVYIQTKSSVVQSADDYFVVLSVLGFRQTIEWSAISDPTDLALSLLSLCPRSLLVEHISTANFLYTIIILSSLFGVCEWSAYLMMIW